MLPDPSLIAIADDEEPVRKALGRLLAATGFRSIGFSSGKDLLASLDYRIPGCVLLDVQMPGLTGLDVLTEVMRRDPSIPVIVLTGHDESGLREQCEAMGAGYLCKPVHEEVLLEAIRQRLSFTQAAQATPAA